MAWRSSCTRLWWHIRAIGSSNAIGQFIYRKSLKRVAGSPDLRVIHRRIVSVTARLCVLPPPAAVTVSVKVPVGSVAHPSALSARAMGDRLVDVLVSGTSWSPPPSSLQTRR